jgi:hypothetical protein
MRSRTVEPPGAAEFPLKSTRFGLLFALLALPAVTPTQVPSPPFSEPADSTFFFTTVSPISPTEGGGAGQVEPAAYAYRYLTKLTIATSGSTLGTGGQIATNLPYHLDLRLFGNYTNFDWKLYHSLFYVLVNIGMSNAGGTVDFYPWKSLRLSPGFLFDNADRVAAGLSAEPNATFTLNNVTYTSDNADPVYGTGRLVLGGRGFMATTGWGHYVARDGKHFTFPFEIGAAFIHKPMVSFDLLGDICTAQGYHCLPAIDYPGFESNLNAQLASWNRTVAPYHVYPLIGGGIAYTFRIRK